MRTAVLCADPGVPYAGASGASAHLRGMVAAFEALPGEEVLPVVLRSVPGDGTAPSCLPHARVISLDPPAFTGSRRAREDAEAAASRALAARVPAVDRIWERHSLFSAGAALSAARGIPRVLEVNAPLAEERRRAGDLGHRFLAPRAERRSVAAATRVIAVSRWLADWARAAGAADVRWVPNGSDLTPPDRSRSEEIAPWPEGTRLRLATWGSFRARHAPGFFGALLDALPEAGLLAIGPGSTAVRHPRAVCLESQDPRTLAGFVHDADLALAPYAPDAPAYLCPLKVVDALAVGTPVLASDVGDAGVLLADGGGLAIRGLEPSRWASEARARVGAPRMPRPRPWTRVLAEAMG